MNGAAAPVAVDGTAGPAAGPVRHGRLVALTLDLRRIPRAGGADVTDLTMRRLRIDAVGVTAGRFWRWTDGPREAVRRPPGDRRRGTSCRLMVDAEASSMLLDVDVVVSFRAGVVRPIVEELLPLGAGRVWTCASGLVGGGPPDMPGGTGPVRGEPSLAIDPVERLEALTMLLTERFGPGGRGLAEFLAADVKDV